MPEVSEEDKKLAIEKFRQSAENLSEADILDTLKGSKIKIDRLRHKVPSVLENMWEKIKLMYRALRAYYKKEYREIPWGTISAMAAALLYFLSPIDVIVDFIPVLGYVDDAAVIAFSLKLVDSDIKKFEAWEKAAQDETE